MKHLVKKKLKQCKISSEICRKMNISHHIQSSNTKENTDKPRTRLSGVEEKNC